MKIVTFKEFASMPKGTLFSFYEGEHCEGLYVKHDTIVDATTQRPIDFQAVSALPNGDGWPAISSEAETWQWGRATRFAVWDEVDVEQMLYVLGIKVPASR